MATRAVPGVALTWCAGSSWRAARFVLSCWIPRLPSGLRFLLPRLGRGLLTRSSGFRRPNRRVLSFDASMWPFMKSVRFEAQTTRHVQIFCICAFPTALAKFCDRSKKSSTLRLPTPFFQVLEIHDASKLLAQSPCSHKLSTDSSLLISVTKSSATDSLFALPNPLKSEMFFSTLAKSEPSFNKAENAGNIGGWRVCAAHCKSSKDIQLLQMESNQGND